MKRQLAWLSVAIMIGSGSVGFDTTPANAQQAYAVQSGSEGQAFLFQRDGRCFALMPDHLLGTARFAELKVFRDQQPMLGELDGCVRLPDFDLAVANVRGEAPKACTDRLFGLAPLDAGESARSLGQLVTQKSSGGLATRTMEVLNTSEIALMVRGKEADDRLVPGLSGSLLYINQEIAGILLSVSAETGDQAPVGRVLRMDKAAQLVTHLFSGRDSAMIERPGCLGPRLAASQSGGGRDLAAAANGGEVVAWPESTHGSEHRPSLLIAPRDAVGFWASDAVLPSRLRIRLGGEKVHVVGRIVLDGSTVSETAALVRNARLYFRVGESGAWSPGIGVVMDPNTARAEIVLGLPMRAREIMIEILSNGGSKSAVALSRVEVYEP